MSELYFLDPDGLGDVPEEVWMLTGQAMTVFGEPVMTFIQASAVTVIGAQGELLADDLLRETVLSSGGQVVSPDLAAFDAAPAPGWTARFDRADGFVLTTPGGSSLYDGTLGSWGDWRAKLRATAHAKGGVVVVTGARGGVEDLGPAIAEGRACWIRVRLVDAADPTIGERAAQMRRRLFEAMDADARLDAEQDHPDMDEALARLHGELNDFLELHRDALSDDPAWSSWYDDGAAPAPSSPPGARTADDSPF